MKWVWVETDAGKQWVTSEKPEGDFTVAMVKRAFSKEPSGAYHYYASRNGRLLGKRPTVEEAKKLAWMGKIDPR